jgi:carnosine N-methyltransferase
VCTCLRFGAQHGAQRATCCPAAARAPQIGFRLIREQTVEAPFLANSRSMMQASTYRCAFWTLLKPQQGVGGARPEAGQQEQQREAAH